MLMSSFVAALVALGAQYWGKKDVSSMSRLFGIAMRLNGASAILFFICCEFFPRKIMLLMTNDPVLIEIAAGYLQVAAWSYLLTGISQSYLALLKISDHASETAAISSAAVVINIGLNAVLIFAAVNVAYPIAALFIKGILETSVRFFGHLLAPIYLVNIPHKNINRCTIRYDMMCI